MDIIKTIFLLYISVFGIKYLQNHHQLLLNKVLQVLLFSCFYLLNLRVGEFEVQAEDDNVETYSETEVEELKNTISDLQIKIAQFKEDAKKQETIKSLKSQVKDLTGKI